MVANIINSTKPLLYLTSHKRRHKIGNIKPNVYNQIEAHLLNEHMSLLLLEQCAASINFGITTGTGNAINL